MNEGMTASAIQVADGDVLVVRCASPVGPAMARRIVEQFTGIFAEDGKRVRVVILDPAIDLTVLHEAAAAKLIAFVQEYEAEQR